MKLITPKGWRKYKQCQSDLHQNMGERSIMDE